MPQYALVHHSDELCAHAGVHTLLEVQLEKDSLKGRRSQSLQPGTYNICRLPSAELAPICTSPQQAPAISGAAHTLMPVCCVDRIQHAER